MTTHLRVIAPGVMTTVQDLGRLGYQHLGVPPSGPLDHVSMRAANLLVGNPPTAAVLEIAYAGPTLAVEGDSARIAFAGAAADIEVLGVAGSGGRQRLRPLESARLLAGEGLRIGALAGSAVAYLAIEGGLALPSVMGSLSTLTRAGLGGFAGRALRAGDLIPLCQSAAAEREELALPASPAQVSAQVSAQVPARPARIRVVLGPQDDHFTARGLGTLLNASYTITRACDRMGMRLAGPPLEHSQKGCNILSDGIATGAIQVPGDGLPIVLLADRQTTGGYPKIATVISADIASLGRMAPGGGLTFVAIEVAAAEAAARLLSSEIAAMPQRLMRRAAAFDAAKLMGENLVSGMVDAREPGVNSKLR
jgi:biotin-dependent carboxylase-like uncharacterized protein